MQKFNFHKVKKTGLKSKSLVGHAYVLAKVTKMYAARGMRGIFKCLLTLVLEIC